MKIKPFFNKSRNFVSYLRRKTISGGYPEIYNIEATNCCPMNCIMCPRQFMKRDLGHMDQKLFEKIIDQLKGFTDTLALHHFGESLICPNIDKMIKYASKKGIRTTLSVNAVILNPNIAKKIMDAGLSYLHISLDGVDDEMYKKIRGDAADYQKALKNVMKVLEYKKKNNKNTYITVGMINMKLTQDKVDKFKKQWERTGADEVQIKEFTTWEGSSEKIINLAEKKQYSSQYNLKNSYPCIRPWHRMSILWDGRVVPCCFDYDGKFVLGDLKKQTLKEIWNGKKMIELRKQHIKCDFKNNNLCRNCKEKDGFPPGLMQVIKPSFIKRVKKSFNQKN